MHLNYASEGDLEPQRYWYEASYNSQWRITFTAILRPAECVAGVTYNHVTISFLHIPHNDDTHYLLKMITREEKGFFVINVFMTMGYITTSLWRCELDMCLSLRAADNDDRLS